jgi:hypothetical protein
MGVNANFSANFSTFQSAVDAAIVKLADFGKGAEKVETQLNNMVDKWSGRALIQQANEMVIAIEHVGGATALTTTEQVKLNAILTEAIAKYKALGAEVPPEMQKLADETKAAATATKEAQTNAGSMQATLTSLATTAAAAFSVQAISAYVGKLIDGASALNTLSIQTHINVEDLQILAAATSGYGVSSEELGRALFNLQSKIAGGDASVVSAYARMGIALDDIKGKNANELFLMTERALGQLEGGIRDAAAADLYGGKLGASMSAFSTGVDKAVEDAKRLNKITSEESVKAMAEYGDAIARTKASVDAFVTEGLGKLAQGFNVLNTAVNNGASKWDLFWAGFKDSVGLSGNLTKVLDDVNKKLEEQAAIARDQAKANGEVKVTLDAVGQAALFMATLQKNAIAELTTQQLKDLDILRQRNELTAQNAAAIGVNVQQLDKYKAGLEAAKKAAEDEKKAIADADAIAMDSYTKRIKSLEILTQQSLKAYSFDGQISQLEALKKAEEDLARSVYAHIDSEKVRMKILEDLAAKRTAIDAAEAALQVKQAQRVNSQVTAELEAKAKILAAYDQQADGTLKVDNAQTKLTKAMDDLHAKKQEGISQYYQEQALMDQFLKDQDAETAAIDKGTDAKKRKNKATEDEITLEQRRAAEAMKTFSFAGGSELDPKFANMSTEAKRIAGYIDLYGRVTPLGESVGFGHAAGGAGGRAAGGPVDAGTPYMVGERGPELFVPAANGTIVPNGAGSMGVTINVNGSVLGTPDAIARAVGSAFMSVLKSQGTRLPLGTYGSG